MSNSKLASVTILSPNCNRPRNHKIDTITIHVMAGDMTVESCGNWFKTNGKSSSNYGIGSDGRIGLYLDEADRSWCSSSPENDHRAITIEVANDGGAETGYHVSDKALQSLINLVADICKRNNIPKLLWKADKSLIGQIDKQNMTVHRWFANKACPGDYLYSKHTYIANEVNKILSKDDTEGNTETTEGIKVGDIVSFKSEAVQWDGKQIPSSYKQKVYKVSQIGLNGRAVLTLNETVMYAVDAKYLVKSININKFEEYKVKIDIGALNIENEEARVYVRYASLIEQFTSKDAGVYTIVEEKNGWGKLKSGEGWINLKYTRRV